MGELDFGHSDLPEVLKCYIMLGDCDAMIRVHAADIADTAASNPSR